MAGPAERSPDSELRASVQQAQRLVATGDRQGAIALLRGVVRAYAKAAHTAPSEWHEIQARWALAALLEEAARPSEAAREYEAIARIRRATLVEARHGVAHALIAAADCHIKAGNTEGTRRLARAAARLATMPPLPASVTKALPAIGKPLTRQGKPKGKRRE
jgi:hypothetical protein